VPQESCTEHLTRNDSSMGIGEVCTSKTRAVGRICKLASNLVYQVLMLPARAIALDHVSSATSWTSVSIPDLTTSDSIAGSSFPLVLRARGRIASLWRGESLSRVKGWRGRNGSYLP
jgi:hypothetical protein